MPHYRYEYCSIRKDEQRTNKFDIKLIIPQRTMSITMEWLQKLKQNLKRHMAVYNK